MSKSKYKQFTSAIVNKLDSLYIDDLKQYWKLINDLKSEKHNSNCQTGDPDVWVKQLLTTNLKKILKDLDSLLAEKEQNYAIFNKLDYRISEKEILCAIASLKYGKAKGLDLISNEMLKSGQTQLLPCSSQLFNLCFSTSYYPDCWAKGYISPVFKSDDPCDPNNYRGITITSNLGKLFNNILNKRLDDFLCEHHLIHPAQVGFTKHARTSDHCFIVKCLIDKYCNAKEGRLYACVVDFQKAFESVVHNGMKLKLLQSSVGTKFYNIIQNMYSKSEACVKIGDSLTNSFPIKLGVRQGG